MMDASTAKLAMPGQVATASARVSAIDSLRGLAIGLVVLGHYVPGRLLTGWAADALRPCAVGGVILFFFLSGFLIERNLNREPGGVGYVLRRIFRIVPAYWIAILVLTALSYGVLRQPELASPRTVIANAFFVPDVLNTPLTNGVFWTLLIEVKFYLIAPFLVQFGRSSIMAAPLVAIALNGVLWVWRGEASNLLTYLAFCLVGMCFSQWNRGEISSRMLAALSLIAAVSVGLFSPYFKIGLFLFALINAGSLAVACKRGFNHPASSFVGAISYSWYLYHAGVGYPLMAALEKGPWQVTPLLSIAIGVGCTLTLAWASFELVERTGIAAGRALERRWVHPKIGGERPQS